MGRTCTGSPKAMWVPRPAVPEQVRVPVGTALVHCHRACHTAPPAVSHLPYSAWNFTALESRLLAETPDRCCAQRPTCLKINIRPVMGRGEDGNGAQCGVRKVRQLTGSPGVPLLTGEVWPSLQEGRGCPLLPPRALVHDLGEFLLTVTASWSTFEKLPFLGIRRKIHRSIVW